MFPDLTQLPRLHYEAALLLALSDVEHSLWREAWLVAHRETLLHHATIWG
jgi:hypothetical protein